MELSFMSPEFLGLALATCLLLSVLAGPARQAAFLLANLVFLTGLLCRPESAGLTVVFVLLGYIALRMVLSRSEWFWPALIALATTFVYMRGYSFLAWLLPEDPFRQTISTIGLSFLFFKIVHMLIEAQSRTLGAVTFPAYLNFCLNFTTHLRGLSGCRAPDAIRAGESVYHRGANLSLHSAGSARSACRDARSVFA
jgi:hypothetical protein